MLKIWKCLKSTVLFTHPRITIVEDEVELPNGEIINYIKFGESGQGVTVICMKNESVLLQKEYSYPVNEVLYQFPGGGIKRDEPPTAAACRELVEESGLEAKAVHYLGWYYTNNRRTNAKMHVVLVQDFSETVKKDGDIEEEIISEWIPMSQLKQMIKAGEIVNYSVLAALSLLTY
jgi:ADP-ribose pyrophosphatase